MMMDLLNDIEMKIVPEDVVVVVVWKKELEFLVKRMKEQQLDVLSLDLTDCCLDPIHCPLIP